MRSTRRLTALRVKQLTKPGRYADGDGLYLQIDNSGGRSWIFMYRRAGRRRIMGLGSARIVALAEARDRADEAASTVRKGEDPILNRKKQVAGNTTFEQAANKCFDQIEAGWRSDDHRLVWKRSFGLYAKSLLHKSIGEITTDDIDKVLRPLWLAKPETAIRLRGRLERVLDWAKANDLRDGGPNPAAWRGNLKDRLPAQPRHRQRVKHHPALPYDEIPALMAKLRAVEGVGARVLEFLILSAARSAEALGAQWSEIDLKQKLWIIPGERMKSAVAHAVPLCDRAIEILNAQFAIRSSAFVFPGFKDNRPLDRGNMRKVLQQLVAEHVSLHGFRSTFRDWAGDRTSFHKEAEMALAHVVGDETERAYRRGTALDKRRELMDAWAQYCERPPLTNNVVEMRKA